MRIFLFLGLIHSTMLATAQLAPTLLEAPYQQPGGQSWVLVEELSDEFNDSTFFDTDKWLTSPETYTNWRGRIPGIFAREAISVAGGSLRIRASKLTDSIPVLDNGVQRYWTHQGGLVRSRELATAGTYFECRMKANQTFMSSTFWVINVSSQAGTGCNRRVTELDITESIGTITNTDSWAQSFDKSMHSNTHDRRPANMGCSPNASNGNSVLFDQGKVYDDFHVYGAWWKSPTEVLFFLDGIHQYTISPPSSFDLSMHIMMVVETYNWNPPRDGTDGMEKPESDRFTYYDWTRTWRLDSQTGLKDQISQRLDFQLAPNPARRQFDIFLGQELIAGKLQILDIQGRVVYAQNRLQSQNRKLRIKLPSSLPQGLYMVQLQSAGFRGLARLMVGK